MMDNDIRNNATPLSWRPIRGGGLILAAVSLMLWGCPDVDDGRPDPAAGGLPDVPEWELDEGIIDEDYTRPDFEGLRNPFEPDDEMLAAVTTEEEEEEEEELETETDDDDDNPLTDYRLEELELVAIFSGTATPRAMFVTPEGTGYTVGSGDDVGEEGGRIMHTGGIRGDSVRVDKPTEDDPVEVELRERRELTAAERERLRQMREQDEEEPADEVAERERDRIGEEDERFRDLAPPQ